MTSRGRPRSFDRQAALQAMMEVFWIRGYEGAQLSDLTAAAGINPPSFYAAFESKEAAFCEAVDQYLVTVGERSRQALETPPTLRQALRNMFLTSIEAALAHQPGGCMLILGVVNCLPANEQARLYLKQARHKIVEAITARIERGRHDGDIPADTDIEQMAAFFYGITQAISLQARDGSSREELIAMIDFALRSLDAVVVTG
ncbi:TetR/AcrR family transcriptional regulator [Pantoea sp. At-9b]|uniref:TetR/AcrR family transcriptional regulator n=1 Tax=Pantoea sp. (strain At-9b) TaxID=592316 RepID=UPI0001F25F68|nr:TetR/AcrR family transcriptional regulator [Pantoea sp. At-9b]ADU72414.1 transcriptional regulator, TetR family [Pantoea sp. At-9b]